MDSQKAGEYKRSISEQAEAIKQYVTTFEVYMAKDEIALGEICTMMDNIAQRVEVINRSINEQAEAITHYVNTFEKYRANDDQAFGQVLNMMEKLTRRIEEIDQAHKKRILLLGELNKTYKELENSHSQFARIHKKVNENA